MTEYKQFPDRILPASEKGDDYTKSWGEAIYAYYKGAGNRFISNDTAENFKLLRKYGEGRQPEETYKDAFALERNNKSDERKGLNNLNFKIESPAPRILDAVTEILTEKKTRLNVVFLDELSSEEKRNEKYRIQAMAETEPFVNEIDKARGVETPKEDFLPNTKEELDMFEINGGIKLPFEIALEQGLDFVFNYDIKWDNMIADNIYQNLEKIGVAGTMDYFDAKTNTIRVRTVDPVNIIIDGSKEYDYSTSQFFGELKDVTIFDVCKTYKRTTGKEISEDEVRLMAANGTEVISSENYNTNWYTSPTEGNLDKFMPYRVKELDFFYLSVDIVDLLERKKTVKHEINPDRVKQHEIDSGKIVLDNGKYYKKVSKKKKKIELEVWRRGKMIIDSGVVYDYGLAYDQIRDENMKPIKPFHLIRLRSKSIIAKITTHLDALQMNSLRMQNLKAKIKSANIAIDIDSLSNIKMGGQDYSEKQVLRLWDLGAPLLYKSTKGGNPYDSLKGLPIQELRGGMGEAYSQLRSDSEHHYQQIQITTGLNEVALASNPNPEVTLGQSEIAMNGAKNAIMNIHKAVKIIKESTAYSVAVRLQGLAKKEKNHSLYKDVMGKTLWKALGSAKEKSIAKNEIRVIDDPSKEEINTILESINLSIQAGTLEAQDMLYAKSMIIEGKPLKLIVLILENRSKQRKDDAEKNALANSQQNQQAQESMQAQKLEAEAAKNKAKFESEAMLSKQEFDQDMIKQQNKYDLELRNQADNDEREARLNGEFTKDNNS